MHRPANFDEMKQTLADCGDSPETYRKFYFDTFGKVTTLTDDDIIIMVGTAEDDQDPADWAKTMTYIEEQNAANEPAAAE